MTAEGRCPPTGCMDDICHGTKACMRTGYPLAERCPVCNEVVYPDFHACACERMDDEGYDSDEAAYYEATEGR